MNSRILILIFLLPLLLPSCKSRSQEAGHGLWPPVQPYESGYIRVSDIHELYYELVGNPRGKPVIVLHGGPGGSCRPVMRQFFNPEKFKVLLFDQRGAGRSRPQAELRGNDTWELVSDIETLREHFGMERMMIVGGSWGSTLALAYAEQYPERVTDMVLRGIFTGTDEEIDHFYHGGTAQIFPDAYGELLASLPRQDIRPLPDYLFDLLTGDDPAQRENVADAWMKYEWWISDIAVDTAMITRWTRENSSYSFSLIENYYMANRCFLDKDQLWEDIGTIRDIPVTIVHGRFDIPCRLSTAYRLHLELPLSDLVIVEQAGHGGEPVMEAVTSAVKRHEP